MVSLYMYYLYTVMYYSASLFINRYLHQVRHSSHLPCHGYSLSRLSKEVVL